MGLIDSIKNAALPFFTDPKPGEPPNWVQRLKKASYQSPSGQVVPFEYADVESSWDKRTTAYDSALGDGTYVQDNGKTSGRFPMVVALTGNDYDVKAQAFLSAVLERGEGVLSHPIYGDITVVPFGEISRADNLSSGGGAAIFTVTFYETTGINVTSDVSIPQLSDQFLSASAVDFEDNINVKDAADKQNLMTKIKKATDKTARAMKGVAAGQAAVQKAVDGISNSLSRGLDTFIGQPLLIAKQTQMLMGEPARIADNLQAKASAYNDMLSDIFAQTFSAAHEPTAAANNFIFEKMRAGAAINALSILGEATVNAGAESEALIKQELVNFSLNIQTQLEQFQQWHDLSYEQIEKTEIDQQTTDHGDGTEHLKSLVAAVSSRLIKRAFSALNEYRFVTKSERSALDLCFEMYGTEEKLEFFISSNDLGGDEISYGIPQGREIVVYL